MNLVKKILPDVIVIVLFAIISYAYFYPAISDGRILAQHDAVAGIGAGEESREYYEKNGERTRWTNSIFGGMPTYQMAPSYNSTDSLNKVATVYHLNLPQYVWYVFIMLLGFYILLRAFDFKVWLAGLGAVIWAFSSYFFIIIAAGHIWKLLTLAYIPPTIAGMVLVYRNKLLLGGIVTAVFVALQVMSNHVQMSYYFLFVMLFMAIAYGVMAWKKGEFPKYMRATVILIVAGLVGVCVNLSNLYHTYEYSKETMRGKSELTQKQSTNSTKSGLDRDYITAWSYGIGETFSLLVPNVKGGASVPLSSSEVAMKKANPMYGNVYTQISQYWGEQPGTSGPVYVGAFVMFLFILGIFIVKGPMKWALLSATVFSILLSWGKNFMWFTNLFLDYVPMYDKFRAVSSILVIAEFTIPFLAMLALKEVITNSAIFKQKENRRSFYISFALTGGLSLLFVLFPKLFFPSYISSMELPMFENGIPQDQLASFLANITDMRVGIFKADAWRSFIVVSIGVVMLWAYISGRIKKYVVLVGLSLLCLIDMWDVNKRYLYDDLFVYDTQRDKSFKKSEADIEILKDTTLDYRVLNLASNTFNENNTSYWHKSVGGYHAAKLRRYQEMIENYISPEMTNIFKEVSSTGGDMNKVNPLEFQVVNMLNTKYFIFPLQGGSTTALKNPYAFGNAWFVNQLKYVDNADQEIEALKKVNLRNVAVVDKKFENIIKPNVFNDSTSIVKLISYEPNKLVYDVSSQKGGTIVFSEIYYPGWRAFVDGNEVEIGRANYILRALNISAGKHRIEFNFYPKTLQTTEFIAYIALSLIALFLVIFIILSIVKAKRNN